MNYVILTQEDKHKRMLKEITFNHYLIKSYGKKKISRTRSMVVDEGINLPKLQNEYVSDTGRSVYPEFMEYCYFLEGWPKKLLFYIIFHHVNIDTCEFIYNDQIIYEFKTYNDLMNNSSIPYTLGALRSAHRKLVKLNIIVNVKREKYMLNPMLMGGTNSSGRRILINRYSDILLSKGKNVSSDFYPTNK